LRVYESLPEFYGKNKLDVELGVGICHSINVCV
jgi:hypothetical protein